MNRIIKLLGIILMSLCFSAKTYAQEQISLTTTQELGETFYLSFKATGTVTVEGAAQDDGTTTLKIYRSNDEYFPTLKVKAGKIVLKAEKFTELKMPGTPIKYVSSLDITQAPNIEVLELSGAKVESLDLTKNIALKRISLQKLASLKALDLSKSKALHKVYIYDMPALQDLNLSSCSTLADLTISDVPKLGVFSLQAYPLLEKLELSGCNLSTIDLSKNPKLELLRLKNNKLKALDVSMLPKLELLEAAENQIEALDLSHNPELEYFYCSNNRFKSLDFSNQSALHTLYCSYNVLESIRIGEQPKMERLALSDNRLSEFDISLCPKLTELDCRNNRLKELDLRNNVLLKWIYANNNLLRFLDVSTLKELYKMDASGNPLQDINYGDLPKRTVEHDEFVVGDGSNIKISLTTAKAVGSTIKLGIAPYYEDDKKTVRLVSFEGAEVVSEEKEEYSRNKYFITLKLLKPEVKIEAYWSTWFLDIKGQELKALDISQGERISNVYVQDNKLSELNLKNNRHLIELYCDNNELTALDVSSCKPLKELYCNNNKLKSLKVCSLNTKLRRIEVDRNELTSLEEVQQLPKLVTLLCAYNKLERLDFTACPNFWQLNAAHNKLVDLKFRPWSSKVYEPSDGELKLKSGFLRPYEDLRLLQLQGNRLPDDVTLAICKALPNFKLYKHLSDERFPAYIYVVCDPYKQSEDNYFSAEAVRIAKEKGWAINKVDEKTWKGVIFDGSEKEEVAVFSPEKSKLSIYPNPVSNLLMLSGAEPYAEFQLLSLDGLCLKKGAVDALGRAEVNLSHLPDALYLLKIGEEVLKINVRH